MLFCDNILCYTNISFGLSNSYYISTVTFDIVKSRKVKIGITRHLWPWQYGWMVHFCFVPLSFTPSLSYSCFLCTYSELSVQNIRPMSTDFLRAKFYDKKPKYICKQKKPTQGSNASLKISAEIGLTHRLIGYLEPSLSSSLGMNTKILNFEHSEH